MNQITSRARAVRRLSAGILVAGVFSSAASAAWPDQPINMIIAYAPGGGTDIIARSILPFIEANLGDGVRINVINRPGAGGDIGFAAIAAAAPDGYTIGFINTPPVFTIPIERKTSYTWQSFDVLGNLVDDPGTFCLHQDNPIKTLSELATFAKANPKAVTVGTTGVGSDDHLAMLLFEKSAGVQMTHVPFKGSSETRTAVTGKHITLAAINVGEALQYLKGGSPIRCLGQMTSARLSMAPDWPTFIEQGYKFEMASLRGLVAPKGLPAAIRERLVSAIERAVALPAFKAAAEKAFAPVRYLAPAAYEAELRAGDTQFRALWKELPWTDK
ncbi:MAG: tripartite tricarboxylate transporter substrate binding protein [Burkholderiales bacterium]